MAVVKVICKNLKNNPQCPHGPTLRFVRAQNGRELEFFACSTYRDRKDCGFYLAVGDKLTERVQEVWTLERKRLMPSIDVAAKEARLREVQAVPPQERLYCHTCCDLDTVARREQHSQHHVQTVISDTMLANPSKILKPKEASKKEAQFLFADSTTKLIVENLEKAGVARVLCLGTPRVHEYIQANCGGRLDSLLLDMDYRYHSFWLRDKFVWYNMFNREALGQEKKVKNTLRRYLAAGVSVALVMDPPFGGHVEPLAATVRYFSKMAASSEQNTQLLVIWVFPYFRERHIVEKCPSLVMLDYQVQYDNHKQFNNGSGGRKLGSPVRLFTNIRPRQFVLPNTEGYRLCTACAKYVAQQNRHCRKCGVCPSKDGRTYVHCDSCGHCVKPQWSHCSTCQKCLPSDHNCVDKVGQSENNENKVVRHKRIKKQKKTDNGIHKKKKLK